MPSYIDSKTILDLIRAEHPLAVVQMLDPEYLGLSKDFIVGTVIRTKVSELPYDSVHCDCDNLAAMLWGRIKEIEISMDRPIPLGIAVGTTESGMRHMTNCFVYLKDGTPMFSWYDVKAVNVKNFKPNLLLI